MFRKFLPLRRVTCIDKISLLNRGPHRMKPVPFKQLQTNCDPKDKKSPLNNFNATDKQLKVIYRACILLALGIPPLYLYYKHKSQEFNRKMEESREASIGKTMVGGKFRLVDFNGKVVSEKDFSQKYTLVYFGYTFCPDICPQELEKVTEALDILSKTKGIDDKKIVPLFISCDTKRDSLESIKEYLQDFHPTYIGLSGTPNQVKECAKAFRIYFSSPPQALDEDDLDYIVDHSTFTYLMSPKMEYVAHFSVLDTPNTIANTICNALEGRPLKKAYS